jgi:hypothetical protein
MSAKTCRRIGCSSSHQVGAEFVRYLRSMEDPGGRGLARLADAVPAITETAFGAAAVTIGLFHPSVSLFAVGSPIAGYAAKRLQAALTDGEAVLKDEAVDEAVIVAALARNDAMLDLFRETVDGAFEARDRAQRRAMARAFAQAAKDDALVEPGIRITRVLAQMDDPEVQALRLACLERPHRPRAGEEQRETRAADEIWPVELGADWSLSQATIVEVMARLVALGLAADLSGTTVDGLLHWRATAFGRTTAEALEREARDLQP